MLTCASPVRSWGLQMFDLMSETSSFGCSSRLWWSCPHGPEFLCIVRLWHADLVKLGTSNFSLCCTGQGGKLEHGTSSADDLTLNSPSRLFARDMTIPICSILSLTARCLLEVLKELPLCFSCACFSFTRQEPATASESVMFLSGRLSCLRIITSDSNRTEIVGSRVKRLSMYLFFAQARALEVLEPLGSERHQSVASTAIELSVLSRSKFWKALPCCQHQRSWRKDAHADGPVTHCALEKCAYDLEQ